MPPVRRASGTFPPDPAKRSGVKLYRSINGHVSFEVIVCAENDSEEAVRSAKDLALKMMREIRDELSTQK